MTPEEIAAKAEADVQRHEADTLFLIACGQALAAESDRRRAVGEDSMTKTDAAALLSAE